MFLEELDKIKEECELFLIAGDVIDNGAYVYLKRFENDISKLNCTKIMVRGNNEFTYEATRKYLSSIILLEDEVIDLKIQGKKISIIGTPGILDKPTRWQRRNIPNIDEIYRKRFEKIKEILERKKGFKILLSHYAITYSNLVKEKPWIWPEMGSKKWEEVIDLFDIGIHGHSHMGKNFSLVKGKPIYNVAYCLTRRITRIDVEL